MDLTAMRDRIKAIDDSISYDKAVLDNAVHNNEVLDSLEEKYRKGLELHQDLSKYRDMLANLLAICNKKSTQFTDERKEDIEVTVDENLRYLFPDENFKSKIVLDVSKTGRESCKLLLGKVCNGEMVYSSTTAQNGRFVRQLISMVVIYVLNYLRGSDMMYLDEALASSDKENLTKLKPLLNRIVESGIQVILIEHKPELYDKVKRRQFTLLKDRETGETVVTRVEDISDSEEG